MSERTWNIAKWTAIGLTILIILAVPYLPGRTEEVTRERLAAARVLWKAAAIADYNLDLSVSGVQNGDYQVKVRGGVVAELTLNGKPTNSNAPEYFTVDGLFQTLEDYLDHCENPATGVFPEGSTIWLRMRTHPKLGYPIRYIKQVKLPASRGVAGFEATSAAQGIEVRVRRFEPRTSP